MGPIGPILQESVVRPLTELSDGKQQTDAWEKAVEIAEDRGDRVKAKDVEAAVQEVIKAQHTDTQIPAGVAPEQGELGMRLAEYYTLKEWESLTPDQRRQVVSYNPKADSKFNETNDNIKWAKWSWNPVTGCLHSCKYCYARDIANRFYKQKFEPSIHPARLAAPRKTKPKEISEDTDPVTRIGWKNVCKLWLEERSPEQLKGERDN